MSKIDRRGQYYGRLYVLREAEKRRRNSRWLCLCECGAVSAVQGSNLASGHTSSCGCSQRETARRRATKHGSHLHSEYTIWKGMRQRCENPSQKAWSRYGGRGITVCDRWKIFENFLSDMGPRPKGQSLDRIDNAKGYSPENCRWATRTEQSRNTRSNHLITVGGETLCVAEWANRAGIPHYTLHRRLRAGWPPELAVAQPLSGRGWME